MKKILILSFFVIGAVSCESNDRSQCPANVPLFTEELGNQLINNWGNQVVSYSPGGSAGFTDVYVGAAYFTGNNYLSDGVLLPTVSPMTRDTSQSIYDYFTHFLADEPHMTNNPGTPQAGGPFVTLAACGVGVISGYYNFVFGPPNPPDDEPTSARYTFEFEYLTSPSTVSVVVASGSQAGQTITVNQPAGRWYIRLQNSAKLPM